MSLEDKFYTVFTNDKGQHKVLTPEGNELPGLVKTIVVDDCEKEFATCKATFLVRLAKDKNDALEKYKKNNPSS